MKFKLNSVARGRSRRLAPVARGRSRVMDRDICRRQGALTILRRLCNRKSRDPPILVASLAWSLEHYNYSCACQSLYITGCCCERE